MAIMLKNESNFCKTFFLLLSYFASLPEIGFRIAFVHRFIVILIGIMWHYVVLDIYNKFSFHYIILLFQLSYRTCSGWLWKRKFAFYKMLHNLLPNNQCHQHSQTSYRVGSFSSHNSGFKYHLYITSNLNLRGNFPALHFSWWSFISFQT